MEDDMTYNDNVYSKDETYDASEIYSDTNNTGFPFWGESSTTTNPDSFNAVNYVFVTPGLVSFIRQILRGKNKKKFLYHYLYLCGKISYLKHIDKRFENEEFVPVNYKVMSSIISRRKYLEIISDLVNWEIIEFTPSYQVGSRSKGFKLMPPYNQNFKRKAIKDELINKKLNNFKNQSSKELKKLPLPYQYLEVTNTWIGIDYKSATTYNRNTYLYQANTTVYDSNYFSISAYNDKDYRISVDKFANRAHTNLTNIKSDFRGFLNVDGEPLGQVDIKNSQPLFFYIHIKDNPDIPEDEKERYRQIVERGRFYEFFMERLGIPIEDRSKIKEPVLGALFFDKFRTKESRYLSVFKEEFPAITEYILKQKRKDHRKLAQILQKSESKFIIEKAVASFINKFGAQYEFVSTIHDSLVVKVDMLQEAKHIMRECFQWEGINPQLAVSEF